MRRRGALLRATLGPINLLDLPAAIAPEQDEASLLYPFQQERRGTIAIGAIQPSDLRWYCTISFDH